MRFLVTGAAGFIGFHLARRLISDGHAVIGIDGMTPYYDLALKRDRLAILENSASFSSHEFMLEDGPAVDRLMERERPDVIVHLAAQAGVRYSLENPRAYIDSNIVGTFNLLEAARKVPPQHFLLASTSSVYGANLDLPFRENDRADHPLTIYAATKKATELMAHSCSHLWHIPCTAFRFFTVYGPWGRPDMALFKFVRAILNDEPIDVYGNGEMERDFTYIDDLIEAIVRLLPAIPQSGISKHERDSVSAVAPFRIVNIGGGQPVSLMSFIQAIEERLGRQAIRNYLPMQMGDVPRTSAAPDLLEAVTAFRPSTSIAIGVSRFVDWYQDYYREVR